MPEFLSPAYANPELFKEIEVTVGCGEWALPGTITVPTDTKDKLLPGLVLIHGSGPNDRDETIGGAKIFRDISWGLSSRGIVVLRYDKRTRHHAAKMLGIIDTLTIKEEVIDDAVEAFNLLRNRQEVDNTQVFVAGHSLGGMLLPKIGQITQKAKGLISLAGATRPLEDIYVEQIGYLSSLKGFLTAEDILRIEAERQKALLVKDPNLEPSTQRERLPMSLTPAYWLALQGYVPAKLAACLPQPMLILQGERDYQVTMADFAIWKAELVTKPNAEFKSYPCLNHLFIEGEGQPGPKEYARTAHVHEQVISDIAKWIAKTIH